MIKQIALLFVVLLSLSIISASCDEGQIEINTASATELDSLYGIGPVKAIAIINERPFGSVDDLIEVWGIGTATLTKIKNQGLACVGTTRMYPDTLKGTSESLTEIPTEGKDVDLNESLEEFVEIQETEIAPLIYNAIDEPKPKTIQAEIISLNPKDIKTDSDMENLENNNIGLYSFILFCILLLILFMLKKKRKYKTEFEP